MIVHLVVVEGKPLGAVIPLKLNPFVIGRGQDCNLRPRSELVSDRQCAIIRRGTQVVVRDLGSAQGTLVNDRCLRRGDEMRVADGDRLQIGQLIFAIRIDAEAQDLAEDGAVAAYLLTPSPGGRSGFYGPLSGSSIMPVPVEVVARLVAAREEEEAARTLAAAFASRSYDQERGVTCLGLGPGQVSEESDQRVLRQTLFDLAGRPEGARLVLDLSNIDTLPSLCLATLMALARRCKEAGGELRLCAIPSQVKRVLESLRFEEVVGCYDDSEEAITARWVRRRDVPAGRP